MKKKSINPWFWIASLITGVSLACLAGLGIMMRPEPFNWNNFIIHFITNIVIWTLIAAIVFWILSSIAKSIIRLFKQTQ